MSFFTSSKCLRPSHLYLSKTQNGDRDGGHLNDVIHRTLTALSLFFPFSKIRVRSIDHILEHTRIWKTQNNTAIFVRLTCYSNSGIKWTYYFKDDKWNNDVVFLASQLTRTLWRRSSVTINLKEGNEEQTYLTISSLDFSFSSSSSSSKKWRTKRKIDSPSTMCLVDAILVKQKPRLCYTK